MENLKSFKKNCLSSIKGVDYVQFDKVLSTYSIVDYPYRKRYVFSFSNHLILVDVEPIDLRNYEVYSVLSIFCSSSSLIPFDLLLKSFKYIIFNTDAQLLGCTGFGFSDDFQRINQFRSYLHRCLTRLS